MTVNALKQLLEERVAQGYGLYEVDACDSVYGFTVGDMRVDELNKVVELIPKYSEGTL